MDKPLRKIKDAAQQLGTTDATLRLWVSQFRAFMSSTAAPPSGVAREFNDVDMRLLSVVRDMRRDQRSTPEIHAELQRIVDTGELPPLPEPPQSESEKTAYLANVRDQWLVERANLQRDIARMEKDIADLQQRLDAEQQGRREDIERFSKEQRDHIEYLVEQQREEVERLTREAAAAQAELRLWREGQLKPKE